MKSQTLNAERQSKGATREALFVSPPFAAALIAKLEGLERAMGIEPRKGPKSVRLLTCLPTPATLTAMLYSAASCALLLFGVLLVPV